MMHGSSKVSVSLGSLYLVPWILLVDTAGSAYPKEYICDNDFTGYTYNDCHREWSDMGCYRQEHSGGIGSCAPLCNTIHSLRGEGKCRHQCSSYFSTCTLTIVTTFKEAVVYSSDPNTGTSQTSDHQWMIILVSVLGSVSVTVGFITTIVAVCYCKKKGRACFKSKELSSTANMEMTRLMTEGGADIRPTEETEGQNPQNHAIEQRQSVEAETRDSAIRLFAEPTNLDGTMDNAENTDPTNPAALQPDVNPPHGDQPGANPSSPEQHGSNPTNPDQPGANTNPGEQTGANPESSEPSVPVQPGADDFLPDQDLQEQTTNNSPPSPRPHDGDDDGYSSAIQDSGSGARSVTSTASSASSGGFTVGGPEETDSEENKHHNASEEYNLIVQVPARQDGPEGPLQIQVDPR